MIPWRMMIPRAIIMGEKRMTIYVNAQRISRRKQTIEPVPMELSGTPGTLAELIRLCVEACVERQHRRTAESGESVLTQEKMDDLAAVGKIAFGFDANGTPADREEAVANALQSYQDGLFRVFLNGKALGDLEDAVALTGRDVLTFVRLTMLTGGGW